MRLRTLRHTLRRAAPGTIAALALFTLVGCATVESRIAAWLEFDFVEPESETTVGANTGNHVIKAEAHRLAAIQPAAGGPPDRHGAAEPPAGEAQAPGLFDVGNGQLAPLAFSLFLLP